MAKKKFDAPNAETQTQVLTQADVATVSAEQPAPEPKPALPSFHLQDAAGVQYKLIRYTLPKRHEKNPEGDLTIVIDGVSTPAWKTDSKGWSLEGTELIYVYFKLPANDISVYIVLQGEDVAGKEFAMGDGEGTRPNPKSTSKLSEEEKALRLATAKATREANAANKTAGPATQDAPDTAETAAQVHP
jgi:hypothetical protein